MPFWQSYLQYNFIHHWHIRFLHDHSKPCDYDGEIVVTLKSFSIQIWLDACARARVCVCIFVCKIFPGSACSLSLCTSMLCCQPFSLKSCQRQHFIQSLDVYFCLYTHIYHLSRSLSQPRFVLYFYYQCTTFPNNCFNCLLRL